MEISWTITADWWDEGAESGRGEVPEKYRDELEEHALERAMQMMNEGYVSGELNYEDEENDASFRGWWASVRMKNTDADIQ